MNFYFSDIIRLKSGDCNIIASLIRLRRRPSSGRADVFVRFVPSASYSRRDARFTFSGEINALHERNRWYNIAHHCTG